jgi:tRNA-intron endonuclease, archaea type
MIRNRIEEAMDEIKPADETEVFGGIRQITIKAAKGVSLPTLSGDRVIVYNESLANQLYDRHFGEMSGGRNYLNLYESCLLLDEGRIIVVDSKGVNIDSESLHSYANRLNKSFGLNYAVFRDLRLTRGLVTRSGLKFGSEFVVYDEGKSPGKNHSKTMIKVLPESKRLNINDITLSSRLATNVRKKMVFAIVTERGPVYYEVSRAKF